MGATISKQHVILLQNKFAENLRILYPEWAESTVTEIYKAKREELEQ